MATSKATRLAAVNTVISNVGQAPLTSLDTGNPLAELAEGILDEITRSVQTEGWYFNTEYGFPMTPDTDKYIGIPFNVLSLDTQPNNSLQVAIRGGFLYDKTNHTKEFEQAMDMDIVWLVDFEDMPEVFKTYTTIRAANIFAGRTVGSQEAVSFGQREELVARANCIEYETQQGDFTIFSTRTNNNTYSGFRPLDALYRF